MQPILPPQSDPTPTAPFVLFVEHAEVDQRGYWRPQAQVRFAAGLQATGLLHTIPAEELKSLLWVLSFVTPDGTCAPALSQLAEAMRVSPGKARSRLERLVAWRWQGQPVLAHSRAESGLELFSPLPLVAARYEAAPPDRDGTALAVQGGSREAVIAYSRAAYARPRAEVEAEINAQFRPLHPPHMSSANAALNAALQEQSQPVQPVGQRAPEEYEQAVVHEDEYAMVGELATVDEHATIDERAIVYAQLLDVGLVPEQAQALLQRYSLLRIRRQLMWLPYHAVRNRAGFLIAAIKDDYQAPRHLPAALLSPISSEDATEISDGNGSGV